MVEQEWVSGFRQVLQDLVVFLPLLMGATLLLLVGWFLGRVLGWLARRASSSLLMRVAQRPPIGQAIEASGAATQVPGVIAGFVFWVVFVFFGAAAMETLGLPVVTASLSRVAYYLPNVLAALVMVFAGIIAAKMIDSAVTRAAASTGMAVGPALGATVRGTVIMVAIVVAIEQVGIKADILIVMVSVVVGAALAGAGLAFGLGARAAVSNIIASHYVAQAYRVGQTVRVVGVEGKIVQTTPTAVFVSGPDGRVMIPAKHFSESASVLVTESQS
jgi:hypothetical protein